MLGQRTSQTGRPRQSVARLSSVLASMTGDDVSRTEASRADGAAGDTSVVEARWPVAIAAGVFIAISVTLRAAVPGRESIGPHWVVPAVEIALCSSRS